MFDSIVLNNMKDMCRYSLILQPHKLIQIDIGCYSKGWLIMIYININYLDLELKKSYYMFDSCFLSSMLGKYMCSLFQQQCKIHRYHMDCCSMDCLIFLDDQSNNRV